uniref:Uncharacterized protein n=1 Tax=Cyanoderma ruficeps TaxID=181631 RepID=A0A8C3RHF8_9PASS
MVRNGTFPSLELNLLDREFGLAWKIPGWGKQRMSVGRAGKAEFSSRGTPRELEGALDKGRRDREWFGWEGTSEPIQCHPCHGRDTSHCPNGQPQLLWAPCARA